MKEEEIRSKFVLIPLDRIEPNEGQIEGLPANPRDIVDRKFDLLIKSILMHPKMLELRCLMVLPFNDGKFIAIGGNMRHRGLSEIAKMSPAQVNITLGKCSGYAQLSADEREYLRKYWEAWLKSKDKPIPVWHKNRGKEYFIKMCENYPYVALGGIVTKEIPRQKYEKGFPWFIKTAHLHRCKIHGLGYTTILNLPKYHFDSVDSTAWLYGNRGVYLYKFNPSKGTMDQLKADNARLKSREGAVNNFREWVKLCKYAEANW